MTPRENLLAALRRQNPERVPFYFELCPSLKEEFKAKTGADNYEEYYDFDARTFTYTPTQHQNDYSEYFPRLKPGTTVDEWGVAFEPGSVAHFTKFLHAMEDFVDPSEVWDFPMPDILEDYRWEGMKERVDECHEKGYAAVFNAIQIFEPAWYLRGLDNLLCDMISDEEMAEACLKRMADHQVEVAKRVAACGFDLIMFGDDVGSQKDLMLSRELWCKWLKPDMARAIAAAKSVKPDILAFYHSDGVIYDIIEDLIEIGVDVLNPVQPECIDPAKVKEMYGDRLSFWGTVGTQTTMPFGTADEVDAKVKEIIEVVGKGGGLCIAPTHMLEPDVPYENIDAFINAVKKYGKY
ncbi:MAG: hypothetical protein IJA55_08275 [Clostridia bacterium]|nr:hypothetical protein [Clostridia bacterium]